MTHAHIAHVNSETQISAHIPEPHTHIHSLSLTHTHTHIPSHSFTSPPTPTHAHIHILSLSHTHTHILSLSLSLSLTHTPGSESRWHEERSGQARLLERMNDELVRAQRAKEALEAETRRAAVVSTVIGAVRSHAVCRWISEGCSGG